MIYRFTDNKGAFRVKRAQQYNLYLPLTDGQGRILSCIGPNLSGDIKRDNDSFLTPPASIEDLRSNLLCRRDFFLRFSSGRWIRLSDDHGDVLEAGILYQKIKKSFGPLDIEVLNFVPYEHPAEVMKVTVKNRSSRTQKISPFSFLPLYGRSESNLRDHRHVTSLLNRISLEKFGIILKPSMCFDERGHNINKTSYFVMGFESSGRPPCGQFPTLDYFLGKGGFSRPDALASGVMPVRKASDEFQGKECCAAFRFEDKDLAAGESMEYFLVMGITDDPGQIKKIFSALNSGKKIEKAFSEMLCGWSARQEGLKLDFPERDYNNWLKWVELQPTLRKLFGCSFLPHFDYGKGGRGWRDLWQDALTLLFTEPDSAKKLIMHSFKGVRNDGSNATIITKDNNFLSDRNRISRVWMDHGVWPLLTLKLYINRSADIGILLKDTAYFCDHQFERAARTDYSGVSRDNLLRARRNKVYYGSVLEHLLVQNLVQFFNVGGHNIIRLENADWNDGLDMAADKGESVTFSFMYASNLRDISLLLRQIKGRGPKVLLMKELGLLLDTIGSSRLDYSDFRQKQKRLKSYFAAIRDFSGARREVSVDELIRDLEEKSEHMFSWLRGKEFLKEGFFNGYYDNNGRRVEGKHRGKTRMMLAPQVFALMSSAVGGKQSFELFKSAKRYLKDKDIGGFRLNNDLGGVNPQFGRAFGFSFGDKENGALFSHMSVMFAHALYKQGLKEEAFEVFDSLYQMSVSDKARIYPGLPEYFNSQGRGLYSYLTGSASWYIYTLIEEALGIKFVMGDLVIDPKITPGMLAAGSAIGLSFLGSGIKLKVLIHRLKGHEHCMGIKEVLLDARTVLPEAGGYVISRHRLKGCKRLDVYLGRKEALR